MDRMFVNLRKSLCLPVGLAAPGLIGSHPEIQLESQAMKEDQRWSTSWRILMKLLIYIW
jgi:hypothetical protein